MFTRIFILFAALTLTASALMFGTSTPSKVYLGEQAIARIRLGTNLLWSAVTYPRATGGTITTNGDFIIHVFTNSSDLFVTRGGYCDALIIGGGGGGGGWSEYRGGGGGAGGLIYTQQMTLFEGTNAVVVGAGGAGVIGNRSENGANSSLGNIVAYGGGHGADGDVYACGEGTVGSAGGGWYILSAGPGGTNNTPGQGYAGGNGQGSPNYGGGGGGGAGGAGENGPTDHGGNGGAAVTNSITGSPVAYAGGGSSDIYGVIGTSPGTPGGGGGTGNNVTHGTSGVDGTGGGGGSGGTTGQSGSGGRGVVIIRYHK